MVAICLLVLPTQANDLSEQLCADEVFVSMVEESEEMTNYLKTLSGAEREKFLQSEAFTCFQESSVNAITHLATAFKIFDVADREMVLRKAIKKVAKQVDPEACYFYYMINYGNCLSATVMDPYAREACLAMALAIYNQCMGGTGWPVD